ncbi:MAG TPA: hypothetical protein VNS09_06125 [Solirubrobacter sp.]|nr:hypothetical protein [Solirubrobacter sp.]
MLLAAALVVWIATIAVVVGMCVCASRSDRDQAPRRPLSARRLRAVV